ncbi:hypothetical protein [Streptomyces sp. NPDC048650]|uniref:hypothetical protein n=1 Tax=unclassified Streptomyces TaxID=2593676 RepID=UPI00371CD95A
MPSEVSAEGTDAGFQAVGEEFRAVVAEQGSDCAAQLVAHVGGAKVVDLWTGPE